MSAEPLWKLCTAALQGAYGISPEPIKASSDGRGHAEHDQYVRRPVFDTRRMVLSPIPPVRRDAPRPDSVTSALGTEYKPPYLPSFVCVSSGDEQSPPAIMARVTEAVFTGLVVRTGSFNINKT